jgi:hypothetical protein
MSSQNVKMVVLCEDSQHRVFIYRLLKAFGLHRRLRMEVAQEGEGAADQWVRERYPDEVAVHRRSTMAVGLVTAIDADKNSVRFRYQQLNEELDANDLEHRKRDEQICLLVPKRNIETWIYALLGNEVNEEDAYPKLEKESECQPAVERLVDYLRHGWPEDLIPSLERGCRELDFRLPR